MMQPQTNPGDLLDAPRTDIRPEYFLHKRMFAAVFCGFILLYSIVQLWYSGAKSLWQGGWSGWVQSSYGSHLFGYTFWKESNGLLHRALQKNELNDFTFVRDRMGVLHYALIYREHNGDQPTRYAKSIKWMRDSYQRNGTKVYYANIPSRYQPSELNRYFAGIPYQDNHVLQEDLQLALEQFDVPIIDIERALRQEGYPYDGWFYRTDLHWRTESALFAAEQIANTLRKDGVSLAALPLYSFESHSAGMLGTEGIMAGRQYAGLDDFIWILPKDDSRYHWSAQKQNGETFEQSGGTTIFLQPVQSEERSEYVNQYASYLGGSMAWQRVVNQDQPNAPRLLLIGDTFCNPLLAYLAPVCSQIDQINPLAGDKSVEEQLKAQSYDAIVVLYYPGNLSDAAFSFFQEKPLNLPRAKKAENSS